MRNNYRIWRPSTDNTRLAYRESLYESSDLGKNVRDAAALLASKVYYYLGEYDEALSFALGAGNAFEAETRAPGSEEYAETIICEFCLQWC